MLHTSEKLAVRLLIESIILEPAYFLKVVDAKLFRIVSYTAIATGSANLDLFVRCCIYLTTYDWIKSFLKITMKAEPYMEILRNQNTHTYIHIVSLVKYTWYTSSQLSITIFLYFGQRHGQIMQ
jgi:hypothetical protein